MTTHTRCSATSSMPSTGREIPFNDGWRFLRGAASGAERVGFDDDAWRELALPHDYGVEGRFSRNARATVGYLKVGEGWYRKCFEAPTAWAGKRVTVNFDGVMDRCEVWLNGVRLGEHHYGYTAFALNLTDALELGGANVLVVHTNNEEPSSRWYAGAGIYRDVTLEIHEPVRVARYGVQVTTPTLEEDVAEGVARVVVRTTLANDTDKPAEVVVRQELLDAAGVVVANGEVPVRVPAHAPDALPVTRVYERDGSADAVVTLTVPEPHLWSTSDPYRYTVRTTVTASVASALPIVGAEWHGGSAACPGGEQANLGNETSGQVDGQSDGQADGWVGGQPVYLGNETNNLVENESNNLVESGSRETSGLTEDEAGGLTANETSGLTADETVETRIGLRWATLDPDRGLFLNGVNMRALGMCMHHDLGALGAASYRRAVTRQLEILKAAGVNAIRTSHNPCSKLVAEECSRLGFLLLEELTDMWTAPKNRNDYSTYFAEDYPADLASMILRDRNEPSVFMWGMGNEVAWQESELSIAEDLTRRCHILDPTRLNSVNDASYLSQGIDGIGNEIHARMDVRGYSYINRAQMEEVHEKHPNDVILNSESGNNTPTRGYYVHPTLLDLDEWNCRGHLYEFPKGRRPYDPKTYEISDYDVITNRGNTLDFAFDRLVHLPFNVGEFSWTGFDYIGEPAPWISNFFWNKPEMVESDGSVLAPLRSYYGMVDTAGLPKAAYYLYQALWTDPDDAPMVHLIPHWNWEQGESVAVWAYTNAASAELFVNGRSLGVREFEAHEADFHLSCAHADKPFEYRYQRDGEMERQLFLAWEVPFEPGVVEVVARDRAGREVARDRMETAGAPAGIELLPDRHVIAGDGRDLAFIEARVVDSAGVVVPRASDELTFAVEHGRLLGCDNGYQACTEAFQEPTHRAYSGKVVAIVASDGSGEPMRVTARARGLRTGEVRVFVAEALAPDVDVLEVRDAAVRIRAGERAVLPATVRALLAAERRGEVPVCWHDEGLAAAVTAAAAEQGVQVIEVAGEAAGLPVRAFVTVTHPVLARPVSCAVACGEAPALPERVLVVFDDGSSVDAPVAWDVSGAGGGVRAGGVAAGGEPASGVAAGGAPGAALAWAEPGIVDVAGVVEGYGLPVMASVRVVADMDGASGEAATHAALAQDIAEPTAILVDGVPLAGFDPATYRYVLRRSYAEAVPRIEPQLAGNASAYVVAPPQYPNGSYVVRVTSEDGLQHAAYELVLDVTPAPVASVSVELDSVTLVEDAVAYPRVSATDVNGAAIDLADARVTFASSDPTVLAVPAGGVGFGSAPAGGVVPGSAPAGGAALGSAPVDSAAFDATSASGAVRALTPGEAALTVTVAYGGAEACGETRVCVVAAETPKHAVSARVPGLRVLAGEAPELPRIATVTFDHGASAPVPVRWESAPADAFSHAGDVELSGTTERFNLPVALAVHVVEVVGIEPVELVTLAGVRPQVAELASEVTLRLSDGTTERRAVTWDEPAPAAYAEPGTFELTGSVAGLARRATACVRVTTSYEKNRDLFSYRNDVYPQVSASYTNPDPKAGDDASLLMDGIVSYTARIGYNLNNRWSTFGNPEATATLEYRFGYGEEEPFVLNAFTVYYCLDGEGVALPRAVDVAYLDEDGSWRAVRGLVSTEHLVEQVNDAAWVYATVRDEPGSTMSSRGNEVTYSFDAVRTSRVRITFTSAPGECVAITEIRGDAIVPAASA